MGPGGMFGDRPVLGWFSSGVTSHQNTARSPPPEAAVDIKREGTSTPPVALDLLPGLSPELKADSKVKEHVPPYFGADLKPGSARPSDFTPQPDSQDPNSDQTDWSTPDTKKTHGKKSNMNATRMRRERRKAEVFAAAVASAPAIETAVTVEPTELLAIGAQAYGLLLADGARRRLDEAVTVLRATNTMVSVLYEMCVCVFMSFLFG